MNDNIREIESFVTTATKMEKQTNDDKYEQKKMHLTINFFLT